MKPSSDINQNYIYADKDFAGIVFVYLVYYIFTNTSDLHPDFMRISPKGRVNRYGLFNSPDSNISILGMSRQRFYRIVRGRSMVNKRDMERWKSQFGFDNYSTFDFSKMKILRHSDDDWGKYLTNLYFNGSKSAVVVKLASDLKKMMISMEWYKDTGIYNIYYYLSHQQSFVNKTNLKLAMGYLEITSVKDWDELTPVKKQEYKDLLEKHYFYLIAKSEVERIEEEDRTHFPQKYL